MTREEANSFVDALTALRDSATDAQASIAAPLYPVLKEDGALVAAGTRINWHGTVKRATVDLWDTAGNDPDSAPAMWEDINYREGHRIIPETITVGIAFSLGEYGWWGDTLYKSLADNNVYTPEQYPDFWALVE